MNFPATSEIGSTAKYELYLIENVSPKDALASILAVANQLASDYIFQHNGFNIAVEGNVLRGNTLVTDCVEDEWFIVWILCQLSKIFATENLAVRIEDEDGEFLLIEAAEALDKWITPQNAFNRVWIYNGQLHIIPLIPSALEEEQSLTLEDALKALRNPEINTVASQQIQDLVFARTIGYPDKIKENHHKTLAYLPTDIARALGQDPRLVMEAINAFYHRDPDTLKSCQTMSRFSPGKPSVDPDSDNPLVPVLLTRSTYAQLVFQKFFPPKPFQSAGWSTGSLTEVEERRQGIGMKISSGFEMLYQPTKNTSTIGIDTAFDQNDSAYIKFLDTLTSRGYFDNEIKGSALWQDREKQARHAWIDSVKTREASRPSFASRVEAAIEQSKLSGAAVSPIPLGAAESALSKYEDSDAWILWDETQFEAMLEEHAPGELDDFSDSDEEDSNEDNNKPENRKTKQMAKTFKKMVSKVEGFIDGKGSLEGAQFSDEESESDEESMDEEERTKRQNELVPPLKAGEWGRVPASAEPQLQNSMPKPQVAKPIPVVVDDDKPPPLRYKNGTSSHSSVAASRPKVEKPQSSRQSEPLGIPRFAAQAYDGASDDSSDSEADNGIVEEVEISSDQEMDMKEEVDEFLQFAVEALGLTPAQYQDILGEREKRGAFIPSKSKPKTTNVILENQDEDMEDLPEVTPMFKPPQPSRNPKLSEFDTLMDAMDKELSKTIGKTRCQESEQNEDTEMFGDDEELDEDLDKLLKTAGLDIGNDESSDLNLIKSFLDSFQNQSGTSGPAGNLAGRLGFKLPTQMDLDN